MPDVHTLVKGAIIFAAFVLCLGVSYLLVRRRMREDRGGASLTLAQTIAGAVLTIAVALLGGGATTVVVNNVPALNTPTTTDGGTGTSSNSGGKGEAPRPPGAFAPFVSAAENLCLDVQDASTEDSAPIVLARCAESDSQAWSLVDYGNGTLKIVNRGSGKCLDVQDKSREHYAQIVQWVCYESGGSQLWRAKQVASDGGSRYWTFRNSLSGRCLGPGFVEEVKQLECADEQGQIWRTPA